VGSGSPSGRRLLFSMPRKSQAGREGGMNSSAVKMLKVQAQTGRGPGTSGGAARQQTGMRQNARGRCVAGWCQPRRVQRATRG